MALSDTGLVCRYYFDQAGSGTSPTQVNDSSANAYHLTEVNYGSGNLAWTETSGNRGLECTATTGTQRARRTIDNTSDALRNAVNGVTKATIEVVVRLDGAAAGGGRIFGINNRSGANGEFVLKAVSATGLQIGLNDVNAGSATRDLSTRSVVHVVFDSTQATQNDRLRIAVNGGTLLQISNSIALNATIALSANLDLIAFNRESGGAFDRSIDGVLYYAALYAGTDFDATRVGNHNTTLSADDDTPAAAAVLSADSGSFVLTGIDAALIYGSDEVLSAEAGAFTLTGTAASLKTDRRLTAQSGTFVLTGADALRDFSMVAASGSFALTGQDATLTYSASDRTIAAEQGSFTLTGTAASLEVGRRVSAEAGGFTLAGQAASLEFGRKVAAESGSFALAGQAAALTVDRSLSAEAGSFTLTGQDATLTYESLDARLNAEAGAFSLSGPAASLKADRALAADSGSVSLTGQAATLRRGWTLAAESGQIVVTGGAAALKADRRLAMGEGAYALTGTDAGLSYSGANKQLSAEAGSFALEGMAAGFVVDRSLTAGIGLYALTGGAATLTYSGAIGRASEDRTILVSSESRVIGVNSEVRAWLAASQSRSIEI